MSDLPNGIPALIEKKVQEERKLIAEWLRGAATRVHSSNWVYDEGKMWAYSDAASKIERGEYSKGEGE